MSTTSKSVIADKDAYTPLSLGQLHRLVRSGRYEQGMLVKVTAHAAFVSGRIFYLVRNRRHAGVPVYGTIGKGIQCSVSEEGMDAVKRHDPAYAVMSLKRYGGSAPMPKPLLFEGAKVIVYGRLERLHGCDAFINDALIEKARLLAVPTALSSLRRNSF